MFSEIADVISSDWNMFLIPAALVVLVGWLGIFLWKREACWLFLTRSDTEQLCQPRAGSTPNVLAKTDSQ